MSNHKPSIMKKKKIKKLSLNKKVISELRDIKGGIENQTLVGTRVGSWCPDCVSVHQCPTDTCNCFTLNGGTLCTILYCPDPNNY